MRSPCCVWRSCRVGPFIPVPRARHPPQSVPTGNVEIVGNPLTLSNPMLFALTAERRSPRRDAWIAEINILFTNGWPRFSWLPAPSLRELNGRTDSHALTPLPISLVDLNKSLLCLASAFSIGWAPSIALFFVFQVSVLKSAISTSLYLTSFLPKS
jgi:hypothetical protein